MPTAPHFVEGTFTTLQLALKGKKKPTNAMNSVHFISKHELVAISGNITLLFRLNVRPSLGDIQQ